MHISVVAETRSKNKRISWICYEARQNVDAVNLVPFVNKKSSIRRRTESYGVK